MFRIILSFILLSLTGFANSAVTIVSRPVITTPAKTVPVVRVSQSTPRVSNSTSNSTYLPLYVPMIVAAGSANAGEVVQVATPMLTVCTTEEFEQAQLWQQDCSNLNDINSNYCPILSYFRYCKEATPDEVKDLKPAKENYKHVFIKN